MRKHSARTNMRLQYACCTLAACMLRTRSTQAASFFFCSLHVRHFHKGKNISSIFPHFPVVFPIFPQNFFIFFLILVFRVGSSKRPWLRHCLGSTRMEIIFFSSLRKSIFHAMKKSGKVTLPLWKIFLLMPLPTTHNWVPNFLILILSLLKFSSHPGCKLIDCTRVFCFKYYCFFDFLFHYF